MNKVRFLNANCIKILACLLMVVDHIGFIFFPYEQIFRIIGRVSFPLFAFMIAQGCKYTRNKVKHFCTLFLFAFVCQLVYYLYDGTLYMSVLVTFTLAEACIFSLQAFKKRLFESNMLAQLGSGLLFLALVAFCFSFCITFHVDYGFMGVMLPVICSLNDFRGCEFAAKKWIDNEWVSLALFAVAIVCMCLCSSWRNNIQWFALIALVIVALYNGRKGKLNLKYFFYFFYPLHLVLLEGIALLMSGGSLF